MSAVSFSLRLGLAWIFCISCHATSSTPRLRGRHLEETLVTTSCDNLRLEPYKARLDLFYLYLIQYEEQSIIDLAKFDTAIASAISSSLAYCDDLARPRFAVKLDRSSQRIVSPTVFFENDEALYCQRPIVGVSCNVVRGISSILLDQDATLAKEVGHTAIEAILNSTALLNGLTGSKLIQTEFIGAIHENLAVASSVRDNGEGLAADGDDASSGPNWITKIAISAGLISFTLAALFVYGLFRKHEADLAGASVKLRVAQMQAKRREYFESLEDDNAMDPSWMTTEPIPPPLPNSSITWSVSDLTSDSQSIKSGLRIDRIDEEDPEEQDTSTEYDGDDEQDAVQKIPSDKFVSTEEEKTEIDEIESFRFSVDFEHFTSADFESKQSALSSQHNEPTKSLMDTPIETSLIDEDFTSVSTPPDDGDEEAAEGTALTPIRSNCESTVASVHAYSSDHDEEQFTVEAAESCITTATTVTGNISTDQQTSSTEFMTPPQQEQASSEHPEENAIEDIENHDWSIFTWWLTFAMDLHRNQQVLHLTNGQDDEN